MTLPAGITTGYTCIMPADPVQTRKLLVDYGQRIGLEVAIAPALPMDLARTRLKDRVEKGLAGHYGLVEGSWEKLCHPELLLPGAKSIICTALSYQRQFEEPVPESFSLHGTVARFARGRDYHRVLNAKLEDMAGYLRQLHPNAQTRTAVDTGPLMDRAAAETSGLGWFGRNACIITEKYGSWVVLGEVVTDIELPSGPPSEGHRCGSCELCLAACPTGALVGEFELDINLCISHLTQMRGIVPRHLRPLMGTMVYGCDICQEVCPQNAAAIPGNPEDFHPGPLNARVDLVRLLMMTEQEFQQTLKASTAGWIGRNRLRRNACIALGNLGNPDAVEPLGRALLDGSAMVRAHAVWALGQIGTPGALESVKKINAREKDPAVLLEIAEVIG